MSTSFAYPLRGIHYFATHSFLWPIARSRLIPATILSTIVTLNLFIWTYLPQVAFLAIWHGSGAWFNGVFLVLGEGAAVTALLFEAFFVDESLVDAFDATLVAEGHGELVTATRPVESGTNPLRRLGKPHHASVYSPFSLRQIVEFVVLLPLNFVPWIGVPVFLWLTGYRAGPLQHHRYFKLKGLNKQERRAFVKSKRNSYTGFGCTALVLQLVPVLSMLFLITTAIGSALWACRIEDARRDLDAGVAAAAGGRSEGTEEPPEYAEYQDNPV